MNWAPIDNGLVISSVWNNFKTISDPINCEMTKVVESNSTLNLNF